MVVVCAIAFLYYVHHSRVESLYYTWYPSDTYAPAREWPDFDVKGQPKVVLVREINSLECFEVCYSRELANILARDPGQKIKVTYRVSVQFGKPYWIETLNTGGTPFLMGTGGQRGNGECF